MIILTKVKKNSPSSHKTVILSMKHSESEEANDSLLESG